MKAILEFDLPEERDEFEKAVNGWRWEAVVWDFMEGYLRPIWKHGQNEQKAEWAEEAQQHIGELMDANGLQFGG